MQTEAIDNRYKGLDTWSSELIAGHLCASQIHAAQSLQSQQPIIAAAADAAAARLLPSDTGRIIYAGAGASVRIGVQDGVELLPTYHWPLSRLDYIIAGNEQALVKSVEGAEDDTSDARQQIEQRQLSASDVVIAIAASGKTPFTIAVAQAARSCGALVITCSNNTNSPLSTIADYAIELDTGSEVIAGSTRMAAATGQKIAVNILSTLIMVRLHRVYDNLMVDLASSNTKLDKRRIVIVQSIIDVDAGTAQTLLKRTNKDIKLAVLLHLNPSLEAVTDLLASHHGNLRAAMSELT